MQINPFFYGEDIGDSINGDTPIAGWLTQIYVP